MSDEMKSAIPATLVAGWIVCLAFGCMSADPPPRAYHRQTGSPTPAAEQHERRSVSEIAANNCEPALPPDAASSEVAKATPTGVIADPFAPVGAIADPFSSTAKMGPALEADPARLCALPLQTRDEAIERVDEVAARFASFHAQCESSAQRLSRKRDALERAHAHPERWDVDSVWVDEQDGERELRSVLANRKALLPALESRRLEAARSQQAYAKCAAEAARRRDARLASLASRSVDDLRAIPVEYRLAEERALIAQADAAEAQKRAARVEKLRQDPRAMRVAYSAALCEHQDEHDTAAREIATELRYARQGGGVIDNRKLYRLQTAERAADDLVAENRQSLRDRGLSALSCSGVVSKLAACIATHVVFDPQMVDNVAVAFGDGNVAREAWGEVCSDPSVRDYVDLLR